MHSDALNSMMAERENELMNHVYKDSVERLNEQQLIAERTVHQQIITGLQQQLSDATAVCYLFPSIYLLFIVLVILAYIHCKQGQGRIKTLGGPMPKCHGGPPFSSPSLSGPFLRPPLSPFSPLPLPPVPSSAISLPSFYLFSFRSGHPNTAMGPGERCKLPQWGLGRSPSRQTIWCIFESKRAALVAAIFYRVTQEYR